MFGETIDATQARKEFSDLLDRVQYQGQRYVISRHGKPSVALVPLDLYKTWEERRHAFFNQFRDSQQQANLSAAEAQEKALTATRLARQRDTASS